MSEGIKGKIIKGIGGFYYVDIGDTVVECRARGRFRHEGITPVAGDNAVIDDNYVVDILPRKNSLIRPKVANVDKAFITFAARSPKINKEILDRFLILTAEAGVCAVICINKADLVKDGALNGIKEEYADCGSEILEVSSLRNTGIEKIAERLLGVTSVFAGPSGVGKSSIINLVTGSRLKTGEVSSKISRGRHTTREAVLIPLSCGGYVVDTPGFTSLSLSHIDPKELYKYFAEFAPYTDDCRFPLCSHIYEPTEECGVKMRVGAEINQSRYECYKRIYTELTEAGGI